MKIYIQSPVFQKIVFNNGSTRRSILEKPIQTPVSRSLHVKYLMIVNYKIRRNHNTSNEDRGLSLTITKDTQKTFFNEKKHTEETYQDFIKDIQQGNYEQVITKLDQGPQTKKTNLLKGVTLKNMNQLEKAKIQLLKTIKDYPQYIDAYIQLALVLLKSEKYQDALKHLDLALQIQSNNRQVLLIKARCYYSLKQYKQSLEIYEKLKDSSDFQFNIKFSQTLIKCKMYDDATRRLETIIKYDQENAEAYYLRGLIEFKKKQIQPSTLLLEQALQLSNNPRITSKAISYLVKGKIAQKDFYSASINLSRSHALKKQYQCINKLKPFVDGTISLMKRQFEKGLLQYKECKIITKFLQPIYDEYLAYAYFCNSDYFTALSIYKKIVNPSLAIQYNTFQAQGLLCYRQEQYQEAFEQFEKASYIYPQKMEPSIYRACVLIAQQNQNTTKEASQQIDLAFQLQGKQPNLYYFRAIVKSYNKRYTSALKDLEKAIDKSEDNIAEHFYLRGLLHAQNMRLKEAMKDFSTCIHFDRNYAEAYLQRAKCYQIKGESTYCFNDLQKYTKLSQNSKEAFYWSGCLLFHNNAYDESYNSFQNTDQNNDVLLLKLKCQIKQQQLDKAIEVSNQLPDNIYKCDKKMLIFIKHVIEISNKKNQSQNQINFELIDEIESIGQGNIFKKQDIQLLRAASLLYSKRINESVLLFQELEQYWYNIQQKRLNSESSYKDYDSEQSEELQNEMVLKGERIIQHIISTKYNLMIIYLMTHKYNKADQMMKDIREQVGTIQSDELNFIQTVISNQLEKKPSTSYQKILTFLLSDKSIFHLFPTLRVPLINGHFDCKLSLNFPDIQPPNICPFFDKSYISNIRVDLVENKPEAPWLNRTQKQELIFTQNLINSDISFSTDEEEQKVTQRKQQLQIDERVQRKLDQIIKKN